MDIIKKYHEITRGNQKKDFGISRMEDIYEQYKGEADEPHRHDYYTILIVKKAKGKHYVNFEGFNLEESQVYFISPDQVHQVVATESPKGFVIVFSIDFLIQNNIPEKFIRNLSLFQDFDHTPPIVMNDECIKKACFLAEEMEKSYNSSSELKNQELGAWLKLLLIHCNQSADIDAILENLATDTKEQLLIDFKKLIEKNHKEWHSVQIYADQLNICSDYLNRVVNALTGKTSKQHIQSKIITEAKKMLYFSTLSSSEIGYKLGFSEPSSFSAFFKRYVGVAPSSFKMSV